LAGLYHIAAGLACIAVPDLLFGLLGLPNPGFVVRGLGFMVLLFGLIYVEVPRTKNSRLIRIAVVGKFVGPLGWLWGSLLGEFPPQALWTPLFHDMVWWPFFAPYLVGVTRSV
jgi:hypothetical protein